MAVWVDKFIKPNKYSRPQSKLTAVKKLVLHYTANNGGTAMNHYNYFNTLSDRYASAHMFVDKVEALCIIPLNEIAYHANDGTYKGIEALKPNANFLSIGVEMCLEKDGSFHPDTIKRTEDVFVELCKRFGLNPLNDIVRHYDITHKNCPAPWVSNGKAFTDFKNRVNTKFKGGTSTPSKPAVGEIDSADGKLVRGERGQNVKQLNLWLHELTYTFKTDDLFDQYTEGALLAFQKDYGLKQDAIYTTDVGKVMEMAISVRKLQLKGEPPVGSVGVTTIVADSLNIRSNYSTSASVVGKTLKGHKFPVFKVVDGWFLISTGMWIYGNNGEYAKYEELPKGSLYRVRLTWLDTKSQIGAYANLDSAKDLVNANKDYKVFDESGKVVYEIIKPVAPTVPTEQMYRVRLNWADVKSQIGAYKNLDNAKELADANAGYKVFDESGKVVYEPVVKADPTPAPQPQPQPVEPTKPIEPQPTPVEDHTGHNNIIGKSEVSIDKMVAFVKEKNQNAKDIEEIAKQFIEVGNVYGIRGDIAFCQSIIETGWFKFEGGTAVTPEQHNYCGLGVTSKGMKGNEFATVRDGVTAQIQHLFAYASKDAIPNWEVAIDPRFHYVTRGIAPHWEDLNNRWAMNTHYGQDIVALYNKLADYNYVPPVVDEPTIEEPVKPETPTPEIPAEDAQVSMIKKLIDYFIQQLAKLFGKK